MDQDGTQGFSREKVLNSLTFGKKKNWFENDFQTYLADIFRWLNDLNAGQEKESNNNYLNSSLLRLSDKTEAWITELSLWFTHLDIDNFQI